MATNKKTKTKKVEKKKTVKKVEKKKTVKKVVKKQKPKKVAVKRKKTKVKVEPTNKVQTAQVTDVVQNPQSTDLVQNTQPTDAVQNTQPTDTTKVEKPKKFFNNPFIKYLAKQAPDSDRMNYLDGLKGLLVLLVVIGHFVLMFSYEGYIGYGASPEALIDPKATYLSNMPHSLLVNNSMPLYLFMALIAFFPAYKYFKTKDNHSLLKASVLRYFRFLPMVVVGCLLAYSFREWALFPYERFYALTSNYWSYYLFKDSYTLLSTLKEAFYSAFIYGSQLVSTLWCLHYLFLGSLLTYIFVYFVGNVNKRGWLYLIVSLFLLIDPSYLCFIAGVGVADLMANSKLMEDKKTMVPFLILGIVVGYYPSVLLPEWLSVFIMYAISCFFILTGVIGLFSKTKFLNNIHLCNIGKESFAYIIVHHLVLCSAICSEYIWLNRIGVHYQLGTFICFVTYIALSVIASNIYHRILAPFTARLSNKVAKLFNL